MTINLYVARQLMAVKSETAFILFLTTFWLGRYLMITWDNLNGGIMQTWGAEDLEEEELEGLEELVTDFVAEYKEMT